MVDKTCYKRCKRSYTTESGLFSADALKTLTQDIVDNAEIEAISDAGVMTFFMPFTQALLREYNDWCDRTGTQHVAEDSIVCEYWVDDDSCHYYLYNKRHLINDTEDFSCDYLDNMVRKKYEKQYKQ